MVRFHNDEDYDYGRHRHSGFAPMFSISRSPAFLLRTYMLQSSAYLTKLSVSGKPVKDQGLVGAQHFGNAFHGLDS